MFPQARETDLDLNELGERMRERQRQLTAEGPVAAVRRLAL
jgi:hypothetical protein